MKKKTLENRLADFVEQRLDLITEHLLSYSKSARPDEIRPLVRKWLTNQAICYRGKLCRATEWTAETADYFQKQGMGIEDAHSLFREYRNELIRYCLDKVDGLSDREIYESIIQASDIHETQMIEYCARLIKEQEAAGRRKGGMIVEAVNYPLALLNAQGFIETANRPFARSLGVTPESLVGQDMLALCDSKTVNRMKTALRHKAASKQVKTFAATLQNGKKKVDAHFTVQPLFDSSGLRSGMALCMETCGTAGNDNSGNMLYIEDTLLAALPFPLQVLTEEGEITYSSDAVKTVSPAGYNNIEPLCCFLYRSRYGDTQPCPCRKCVETGQFHMEEFSYLGAEDTRWYMMLSLPLPGENGQVNRIISCVYDMTRRRQIQKQLETEIIVQQRSSLMPQIAMTVAHQLRNPLSVVLGFAEMLAKGMPPNQAVEAVNRILRNAIRCKDIVEELLNFGKGMPFERRILDFSVLISESVRPLLTPSQNRIIEWRLTEKDATVECVPEQLTQAVLSLLDNALRFAESRVVCTLEVKGDTARLRIADDGPGIAANIQERVFEPFFTTRRDAGAIGLGLSLARAVANDYGGSLVITPATGNEPKGACLSLQLPLMASSAPTSKNRPQKKSAAAPLPSHRILVVDDEADLLDLLKTGLYLRGYRVDAVASGVEALERLKQNSYDAVIIDFLLSGALSGADVYAHIKDNLPQLKDHALFITADTMNYQTRLFLETTGCPVLEKPFLMADLAAELQRMIL